MTVNPLPTEHTEPPLMTETVSVRVTNDERAALKHLADREERSVSNYLRKHLRDILARSQGA